MSAHSSSRRRFVRNAAGTTAFFLLAGQEFQVPAFAASASEDEGKRFFSPAEHRFLDAACDCIYPNDAFGPGATALGVPTFIDRQMQTPYGRGELWYMQGPFQDGPANLGYQLPLAPCDLYRQGIEAANHYANAERGKDFADLTQDIQIELLSAFEGGAVHFPAFNARLFFEQLRRNTLEGAFADPIHGGNRHMQGWMLLGFPGSRADFMDWVNQEGAAYPFGPVSIDGQKA
ncbi:gluconate 2-dehydrogenase subunit 3 family protein [Asaia bogorensis]|uniref:Gluconate 2-dehydrogenase,membrane-bound, gamma subunit n=2 Tax=Asaia TaxID=91914 RepID=A0A060QJJ3_9PROT|nr:gluconate 2-dehydrogenase subunit 3 family protein [Asaia bogorensis]CDG40853.1 Gluconate 2-dehydrogenase, membrane-bound, gamma subunit [Asaia bogorensis]